MQTTSQPSVGGCSHTLFESAHSDEVFEPQAEPVNDHGACIDTPSQMTTAQNVMFADADPAFITCLESEYDSVRASVDNSDADLGNFFNRPVKIAELVWLQGIGVHEVFNPWLLYFSNPRVVNRIANFHQLRCKLHVKFLVNGNAFYYGRGMISYQPLPDVDQFTTFRAGVTEDLVEASQRPHVFIDPSNSQGAEMVLPYVYHLNNCSIPGAQISELGLLTFSTLSELKHANGAQNPLRIHVFAWAEELHLAIPTSAEPAGLVPQSDEYGTGVISKPASVFARMAGKLSTLPWIGPYARASSIGASAVSSVAQIFGYSKPCDLETPSKMQLAVGNMANTIGRDASVKLSLDPKQELSVDPRTVGLGGTDEMSIRSIATRESYLATFTMSPSDLPDALLWNCAVTPALWRERGLTETQTELHLTAMCFAVLPFKYWRGNINFRFMIAASGFHRGRLKIVYDPTSVGGNEWNTNYITVVDIAETKDFTISVGWGQTPAILNHVNPVDHEGITYFNDTSFIPPTTRDDRNGVIGVFVANELTVPNSTVNNDVSIHVFVSAGDNFEVFVPDEATLPNLSWVPEPVVVSGLAPLIEDEVFEPQSLEIDYEGTEGKGEPEQTTIFNTMAPTTSVSDKLTMVHVGEEVVSIRNLLKRYCYSRSIAMPAKLGTTSSNYYAAMRVANFPHYKGWVLNPGAIHNTVTGAGYNYVKMTFMNYFTPAFVCRRGGIRWKWLKTGNVQGVDSNIIVRRVADDGSGVTTATEIYNTYNQPQRGALVADTVDVSSSVFQRTEYLGNTVPGATVSLPNYPVVEIELPYYSNNRFSPGKRQDQKNSVIDKGRDIYYHEIFASMPNNTTSAIMPFLDGFVAGADDFSLMFFTGAPIAFASKRSDQPIPKGVVV